MSRFSRLRVSGERLRDTAVHVFFSTVVAIAFYALSAGQIALQDITSLILSPDGRTHWTAHLVPAPHGSTHVASFRFRQNSGDNPARSAYGIGSGAGSDEGLVVVETPQPLVTGSIPGEHVIGLDYPRVNDGSKSDLLTTRAAKQRRRQSHTPSIVELASRPPGWSDPAHPDFAVLPPADPQTTTIVVIPALESPSDASETLDRNSRAPGGKERVSARPLDEVVKPERLSALPLKGSVRKPRLAAVTPVARPSSAPLSGVVEPSEAFEPG